VIELADTSAWTKHHLDEGVGADFDQRLRRGEIATCRMVVLELLKTANNARDLDRIRDDLDQLRDLPIRRREWDRAAEVMHALAERRPGRHRQVRLPDLLVAAAAESAEAPVMYYGHHFERIAEVTGQPMRPLAPLGSL
jgi:predicted nucleic acid-binding protein